MHRMEPERISNSRRENFGCRGLVFAKREHDITPGELASFNKSNQGHRAAGTGSQGGTPKSSGRSAGRGRLSDHELVIIHFKALLPTILEK